jgi:hypothetical protein
VLQKKKTQRIGWKRRKECEEQEKKKKMRREANKPT